MDMRSSRYAGGILLLAALALIVSCEEAIAGSNLVLSNWRASPTMVKENETLTVQMWIANLGDDKVKKSFTVELQGCDREYRKCEKTWATQQVKPSGDLDPGKLPGQHIVMEIKPGLARGENFIQLVVDSKRDVQEKPVTKQLRVPVGAR